MILVGNQRGGAKNPATHLLKEENEHVEVHEIRGFALQNLAAALNETYAISRATKCRKYLFSLSLNPPPNENAPIAAFEDAIDRVEARLGLSGQPLAAIGAGLSLWIIRVKSMRSQNGRGSRQGGSAPAWAMRRLCRVSKKSKKQSAAEMLPVVNRLSDTLEAQEQERWTRFEKRRQDRFRTGYPEGTAAS
ncbi:MAG: hypothetical protein ACRESZ_18320 [Methylococcales bacterium]